MQSNEVTHILMLIGWHQLNLFAMRIDEIRSSKKKVIWLASFFLKFYGRSGGFYFSFFFLSGSFGAKIQ